MAVASTPIRRSGAAQLPYSAEFLWLPRYIRRAHSIKREYSVPVGCTAEAMHDLWRVRKLKRAIGRRPASS
jgi:hypothetical protein